uniref:Spatacsin C-terminal domain-containing protein n=1 Tax=Scylla olivacea TaxID=85551 RepID=A0A0P4W2S9_SCYOL
MSAHRNASKVVVVKKWTDSTFTIDTILRADLEANNKGFLAILGDGRLFLTTWLNKKISTKVIEEVSDGCWQRGGEESEVIITRQTGALVRYSLHFDTGLSCSLQLSAPSLLALIRERDSSIRSLRNAKVWGHSQEYILLQPQSDRLVLLATNAGGCPSCHGVMRTPPLRTAHLCYSRIIAQPITGAELYEYELKNCRLHELVSLGLQRVGSQYTEWGALACSTSGDTIAIMDTERHLYVTDFRQRAQLGKKGGVARSRVTLHQVIWPSSMQPSQIREVTLGLSDTLLTVFCLVDDGNTEFYNYLSFDIGLSSMNSHHRFGETVAIIPGTTHHLPDLFLTPDGVAMLMDEDASISSVDSEVDLGELLSGLREGLEEQSMAKVTEVKAMVEQGLSVFLASCNHQEDWVGLAEMRARQYGQLADLLLSYIPQYAQNETSRAFALSLKYLATHHFNSILEEMNNVLKYIDDENISQMVLQMSEQVSFYQRSAEMLQLPETDFQAGHAELYDAWGDKPMKKIVEDAVSKECLKAAESYLQLKPWVYGTVTTSTLLACCIDVAREKPTEEAQLNVMLVAIEDYGEALHRLLLSSDDLFEVHMVGRALGARGLLGAGEALAVTVVVAIHRTLPDLLTLPPRRWVELVSQAESCPTKVTAPITVGQVAGWSNLAMMFVLCDLFAYSGEVETLGPVEGAAAWQYLLHQHDLRNLRRWLDREFVAPEEDAGGGEEVPLEETAWLHPSNRLSRLEGSNGGEMRSHTPEPTYSAFNLLSEPLYSSDVESSVRSHDSLDSASVAASEGDTWSVRSFEMHDRRETVWPAERLWPITQAMVDLLKATDPFSDLLLNLLAQRGVFASEERASAPALVRRLQVSGAMPAVRNLGGEHPCQTFGRDIHRTVLQHMTAKGLPLPAYDYASDFSPEGMEDVEGPAWARMVQPFMNLLEVKDRQAVFRACLTNLQVVVEHCHSSQEVLLPAFLTMLYAPSYTLKDFLDLEGDRPTSGQQGSDGEVEQLCGLLVQHSLTPRQVVEGLVESFPYLHKVFQKEESNSADVTVYDLLSGAVPFDLTRLFTFQEHNRHGYDEQTKLPCWSDEELVSQHGIHHNLDATYYLREGRPTYACASLLAASLSSTTPSSKARLEDFRNKVYGVALSSWPDRSVCSACVAVLLMAGLDAEMLRVILTSAYLIYSVRTSWRGRLSQEKKKGHESLVESDISCVLQQLCAVDTRMEAAATLLEMLEASVILSASDRLLDTKGTHGPSDLLASGMPLSPVVETLGKVFQDALTQQQVQTMCEGTRLCVEFALLYSLPWPCKLLTKLAEADQWVIFLVLVQVFNFPKMEVLKAAESFSVVSLREHMTLAISHVCYYKKRTERMGRSARSKRSALYAKIGIKSREGSPSSSQSGDERGRSSSPSDVDASTVDDAMSLTTTETNLDLGVDTWLAKNPKDLFSVLMQCHLQENPPGELITAAAALGLPVLASFAGCYGKDNIILCLTVFLYTKLPHNIKMTLHHRIAKKDIPPPPAGNKPEKDQVPSRKNNCCRACDMGILCCGPVELRLIVLAHMSIGLVHVVSDGLRAFKRHHSLQHLTLAIQEAKGVCNQELMAKRLSDSAKFMNKELEAEQPSTGMGPEWAIAMARDIIATALDEYLTNSHQRRHFISALTGVSQLPPFCNHSINWMLVGQLCEVVGEVRHKISYKELLESFEAGKVKDFAREVVEGLREKRCFSEALQVCQLVDLPVFTIVCGQLRAEFENSKLSVRSSYTGLERFLCRGHKQLCEKAVPPEHACTFFTTISEEVLLSAMQYLCLQYALVWCYKSLPHPHPNTTDSLHTQGPHSPPPQEPVSPQPHTPQSGDPAESLMTTLEHRMWRAYIQSHCNKEAEAGCLSVSLPEVLGRWPWEGEDGMSSLDMGQILKAAGLTPAFLTLSLSSLSNSSMPDTKDGTSCTTASQAGNEASSSQGNSGDEQDEASSGQQEGDVQEEEDKCRAIQELVDTFIDRGMLVTACRVLIAFGEDSRNMQRLLLLLRLAEGSKMDMAEKEATAQNSISRRDKQRTLSRSSTRGSIYSTTSLDDDLSTHIAPLSRVVAGLAVGRRTMERIIVLYKVALVLDLSYLYVVHHPNPITLLSLVLRLHRCGMVQLARDLIQAMPIRDADVQSFLVEEAVATIAAGPEATRSSQRDCLLLWEELEAQWKELITLTKDLSGLATQLLDVGQCLGSSYPDQVEKVHSMSVELVVRAHDCFTAASNMEGIGTVLRTALSLTTSLVQHTQWSLLVRLLIGIGRYSEMSYIIDALREHGQFEPLLGRGADPWGKESGLDRALIHYLRSKAPEDTETLQIVALHFMLYSEVAEMWVTEAEKALDQALANTLDLTASTTTASSAASSSSSPTSVTTPRSSSSRSMAGQETPGKGSRPGNRVDSPPSPGVTEACYLEHTDPKLLTQAMQSYAHAAQCFMQDQQFASAMECSRQAELVALQIAHLKKAGTAPALRLLKLGQSAVTFVITHKLRVCEAQLVGRAYNHTVDWGAALYHQFVRGGDESYLTEYLAVFTLTPEVTLDVVKKLEHEGITRERRARVAVLLTHVEESDAVYRVASQLGLKGSIDTCLASPAAPYLRDTVFVQGCTYGQ